jgi:UTP--glucose-1-phosphate uridylyltransferase
MATSGDGNRPRDDVSESLEQQLEQLPVDCRQLLGHYQFRRPLLMDLAQRLQQAPSSSLEGSSDVNRVRGQVRPCSSDDLRRLPDPDSPEAQELRRRGEEALRAGQCALVVLAGGMATRMGGVVKALVEAVPGRTFLDLRRQEAEALGARYGRRPPLWLMTSHTTEGPIREALSDRLDGYQIAIFPQFLSLRLTPEGNLFRDDQGQPSVHAPGHGDLPDALRSSGLLERFIQEGGRLVMVTNLDNLGGGLDPLIVGFHLSGTETVTCEVVDKVPGDRGGIPVQLDGKPVVLEEFRLPESFDPTQVGVFSVNTFLFDAAALHDLALDWTYFTVEKKVDGRPVIQFERLINEVTFALPTRYLHVPRTGAESRFLPVKDYSELELRTQEITAVAHARGMLPTETAHS